MREYLNLGEWILGKWKTQGAFAVEIGAKQGQVSRWISGVNEISEDYQKEIRKLGYKGPWPEKKAKAATVGDWATRAELDALAEDLEDACEVIRFLLRALPEGSRPGVLPRKFRAA